MKETQETLFARIHQVASHFQAKSPGLSPIGYPGGKTSLLRGLLRPLLPAFLSRAPGYAEPFIGGGSTVLDAARHCPTLPIKANDLDTDVYALWHTIGCAPDSDFERLIQLTKVTPTVEIFFQVQASNPQDLVERGFKTLFLIRTAYNKMKHAGPKGGEDQSGPEKITHNWKPTVIENRLRNCRSLLQGRFSVTNLRFQDFLPMIPLEWTVYLDPPYVKAGPGLYTGAGMSEKDHEELALLLKNRDNWVMSYDDHPLVERLYGPLNRFQVSYPKKGGKNQAEIVVIGFGFAEEIRHTLGRKMPDEEFELIAPIAEALWRTNAMPPAAWYRDQNGEKDEDKLPPNSHR